MREQFIPHNVLSAMFLHFILINTACNNLTRNIVYPFQPLSQLQFTKWFTIRSWTFNYSIYEFNFLINVLIHEHCVVSQQKFYVNTLSLQRMFFSSCIFGGSTIFFSLNFSNCGFVLNCLIKLKHNWYFTQGSKTLLHSRYWFEIAPVFICVDLILWYFEWMCINPLLTSWQHLKLFRGMIRW